jgi:nucleoside-diphosphate-sugar epimerase
MNILIIGGTGFLGSYLNLHLNEKHRVDFTYANELAENGIRYRAGKDLLKEVTDKKYDVVINNINPLNLSYIQTLQCIEDVVSFCNYSNAKLIHISSVSALPENRFSNSYNLKKAIPEDYIQTEINSDNYSILRFTQLFDAKGLSRKSQAGLYYLLKEIKSNNPITIFSNNKACYRNYMPVELAISIIEETIIQKLTGVFNAHLDAFTLSFDELIKKLAGLNKNYNSKELIVVGEKEGLPYYIPKQSNELISKINVPHDLKHYLTNAYNLI